MTDKVMTQDELMPILDRLRKEGKKVVFTNGCFDILHVGHVRYLKEAKGYGDILIVAVNSDSSVKSIKGDKRPIVSQSERAEVVAALEMVDYVTMFDEDTPYNVIKKLQPDVLIKGGDWTIDKIVGRDIVEARGGRVIAIPFIEGASTTGIVERVLEKYRED
ncbi:MAG: D-glycero-beta-D-manno-heptose 1-phosphate adenylyltransferase [Nitrospirae bacterium]|nr:D-glycero-beta-D-manno-heptose 1-phosphate adenylyltransferase [Nitrospirota bacterium]